MPIFSPGSALQALKIIAVKAESIHQASPAAQLAKHIARTKHWNDYDYVRPIVFLVVILPPAVKQREKLEIPAVCFVCSTP